MNEPYTVTHHLVYDLLMPNYGVPVVLEFYIRHSLCHVHCKNRRWWKH